MINNVSGSDCESNDSESSSEAPPLPPPRIESLPQDENEDEESLVSESDSDDNESTPPPLPPPREHLLDDEYAISIHIF